MKKNKYILTKAQQTCQEALDLCNNCTVIKSVRSGKTLTILDYSIKKKYKSILWVTPFTVNIDGVKEELKKWGIKLNIIITTYNSLKKFKHNSYDLVVIDECHRITEDTYESLTEIKYTKLVCMTGTYPTSREKTNILENKLKTLIVFTYTVDDAVRDHNVAPYKITILEKELNHINNIEVNTKNYHFYTSEVKSYSYISNKIDNEFSSKRKALLTFNMMRLLNTLPSTIDYIKKYIQDNKDKRFIVFVATQQMAEQCSSYCYHGNKDDKYYNMFKNEEINHLVLVEKAATGITYENLDGCLLTTINSSNASVLQKIFRTILFRPDYVADIKILINKNTRQRVWIEKALKDLEK